MRLETRLEAILPKEWEGYDLTFHELLHDGDGWSVNDSWTPVKGCDRAEAISHLRHRWEVFKVNYAKRARVVDLRDDGEGEGELLLEVDCTPFATVRRGDVE